MTLGTNSLTLLAILRMKYVPWHEAFSQSQDLSEEKYFPKYKVQEVVTLPFNHGSLAPPSSYSSFDHYRIYSLKVAVVDRLSDIC